MPPNLQPPYQAAAITPPLPPLPPRRAPAYPAGRPWRLGATSYVYADDVLPNVERLAGRVEDIELVLFESSSADNLPSPEIVRRLDALRRAHGFSFTIHFPIDRRLGAADAAERAAMLDQTRRIIARVRPLEPFAYILHPEGVDASADAARRAAWLRDLGDGVARLLDDGVPPRMLAVENLGFPFDWCAPLIEERDLAVCVDAGHLWRGQEDAAAHLRRWLPRARVVHLHGVDGAGRDHQSLAVNERQRLAAFLRALDGPPSFEGVVTLEVFSYEDAAGSINVLREMLP